VDLLVSSPDFNEIQSRIFKVERSQLFIGGKPIPEQLRIALGAEARDFQETQLWSIVSATIYAESIRMSLNESTEWDHVLAAKMLTQYGNIFKGVVSALAGLDR